MNHHAPDSLSLRDRLLPRAIGALAVGLILTWVVREVWAGLFIPWWFNTDELVFYYEVIRQLRLEPNQTFFDIPGTPYMTLTSLCTFVWWSVERVLGLTQATPADFAFENVQGVYTLMRALTLGGYVAAMGLAFAVFRRTSGVPVALAAVAFAATLPIHIHYSHFVRTESLGLVLCLAAVFVVLSPSARGNWSAWLLAGALAGAAMGARFHFAAVGLPVLLAYYWLAERRDLAPPANRPHERGLERAGLALAALFVAGAAVTLLHRAGALGDGRLTHTLLLTTPAGPEQYAGAKQTVAKLWILLGAVSLLLVALRAHPRGPALLRPVVNPLTLALLLGFAGGFLLSHPTFLWRGEHQLRSIQFYSDWVDPELEAIGPLRSWWKVTVYYFTTALPERWLQAAFGLGAVLVLWRRQAAPLAFLAGAVVCFAAHPVTMKLWPHHIIPWLPFLCFVAAYPLAVAGELLARRLSGPFAPAVATAAVAVLCLALVAPRMKTAGNYVDVSKARTVQISEMSAWLEENAPPDAFIALSYYALNAEGFFRWIEGVGVKVPEHVKRHRDVTIWWLDRGTLDGKAGFVCASNADIHFFHADMERKNPGSTYNPFADEGFEEVATFGANFYELKVFKFDFRERARP